VESAALGALLAGIALKNIIPDKLLNFIDSEIRTMAYGFFAPLFFLNVGISTDINYIILYPFLILLVLAMVTATKLISSYIMGKKVLGVRKSIILGIGLSVKLSTSIVILKLLFEKGLIQADLYSILIGAMIISQLIVPFLLSYIIKKWEIGFRKVKVD
jgi:Kef-type K+ transport system membrane component KefB